MIRHKSLVPLWFALVPLIFASLAWAKSYRLENTKLDPSAMGSIDLSKDRNGNTTIFLRVEHVAKPTMLIPPSSMYIVWFQQPGSDPENEGQLLIGNDLKGQFRTTTPLHNLDIFITAESDPSVKTPSDQTVLRAMIED